MSFDAISFLRDFGIPYRDTGKGTRKGWVQIQCPYCHDHSWHMGINLSKDYFSCWICNKSGLSETLVYKLTGGSFEKAKAITKEYGGGKFLFFEDEPIQRAERVEIKGQTNLKLIHIRYLEERGFNHLDLEKKYNIRAGYTIGRFPYRIIIPVFSDHVLVNATARDVSGQQERYLSLRDDEGIIPIKQCVYNIDNAGENILIVEGPFDVWRIGGSCVCLFGTAFTMAQVLRILSKCPKNIYIMFDNEYEAQKNATKLASCFAPFVNHVEIVGIPTKDPALLTDAQAEEIRNELQI